MSGPSANLPGPEPAAAPPITDPRLADLAALLAESRAALRAAALAVPPTRRDGPAPTGGWTAAQVLAHVALAEASSGRLFTRRFRTARDAGLGRERATDSLRNALDHTDVAEPVRKVEAPPMVRPADDVSMADALADLDAARARLWEALREADGFALGEVSAPHPVLGPLTLYEWLVFIARHDDRHVRQLAAMTTA